MGSSKSPSRIPWKEALLIAGTYTCVAIAWIIGSGYLSAQIAGDNVELLRKIERYKGVSFVFVTGAMLYGAVVVSIRRRERLISEKRQTEAMLAISTKYESLGQFAARLAHDFNNILTAIQMGTELSDTNEEEVRHASLDTIRTSVKQAQKSISNLMTFVRRDRNEETEYNLASILREHLPLFQQVLGKRYPLSLRVDDDSLKIRGASDLLVQALINLVANARDAMEEKPSARYVEITVERKKLSRYSSSFTTEPMTGDFALLKVTDQGCGIEAEHLTLIFAPLFTTKPAGKGTGLGLTSALHAVKQHLGWMEVQSRPGHGTSFAVFLPIAG